MGKLPRELKQALEWARDARSNADKAARVANDTLTYALRLGKAHGLSPAEVARMLDGKRGAA
jgi:hypothetical protein